LGTRGHPDRTSVRIVKGFPSRILPAPRLGTDQYWHAEGAPGHVIREAVEIDRDGIFRDFLSKLAAHAGRKVG